MSKSKKFSSVELQNAKCIETTSRVITSFESVEFMCNTCTTTGFREWAGAKRSYRDNGHYYQCVDCLKLKYQNRSPEWLAAVRKAAQSEERKNNAIAIGKNKIKYSPEQIAKVITDAGAQYEGDLSTPSSTIKIYWPDGAKRNIRIRKFMKNGLSKPRGEVLATHTHVEKPKEIKVKIPKIKKPRIVRQPKESNVMAKKSGNAKKFTYGDLNDTFIDLGGPESDYGQVVVWGYLTQGLLTKLLLAVFGPDKIIGNKQFKDTRFRPDFYIPEHDLIIEFDGPHHYTSSETCRMDVLRDEYFKSQGLKVMRIPYFIQIRPDDLKKYLKHENVNLKFQTQYPNGFVHPGCVLPADYCELGIEAFRRNLEEYKHYSEYIYRSLNAGREFKNTVPPSCFSIFDDVKDVVDSKVYYSDEAICEFREKIGMLSKIKYAPLPEDFFNMHNRKIQPKYKFNEDYVLMEDEYWKVYQQMKGTKDYKTFRKDLDVFADLTFNAFMGDDPFVNREVSMNQFAFYVGSTKEAQLFYYAVDAVTSYT